MKVLSYIISPEFVYMWIRVATPIIFSSLGGVICSRAGVVNLGLEGIMLISALAGVLGSAFGGSLLPQGCFCFKINDLRRVLQHGVQNRT